VIGISVIGTSATQPIDVFADSSTIDGWPVAIKCGIDTGSGENALFIYHAGGITGTAYYV